MKLNKFCDDAGPYSRLKAARTKPGQQEVLRCTRPQGHEGNHQHADWDDMPQWEWKRTGQPVRGAHQSTEVE